MVLYVYGVFFFRPAGRKRTHKELKSVACVSPIEVRQNFALVEGNMPRAASYMQTVAGGAYNLLWIPSMGSGRESHGTLFAMCIDETMIRGTNP
jgi:hypothetical protein